jgi:Stage II sporulation protein E (SpoIIE)
MTVCADVALVAHALAYVVIANRRFTDLYEWGQRSVPLSLAAEIQHRLLPDAYTCEAGQFSLAGWLEPAGNIAGDTFDFSLERDTLHLSMTDAMGHSVQAATLATVLVGALRNASARGSTWGSRHAGPAPPWLSTSIAASTSPGSWSTSTRKPRRRRSSMPVIHRRCAYATGA